MLTNRWGFHRVVFKSLWLVYEDFRALRGFVCGALLGTISLSKFHVFSFLGQ